MTREKIELLQGELLGLHLAAGHLGYSLERCQDLIAHEYSTEKMPEVYAAVAALSPAVLTAVPKVIAYAKNAINQYPK